MCPKHRIVSTAEDVLDTSFNCYRCVLQGAHEVQEQFLTASGSCKPWISTYLYPYPCIPVPTTLAYLYPYPHIPVPTTLAMGNKPQVRWVRVDTLAPIIGVHEQLLHLRRPTIVGSFECRSLWVITTVTPHHCWGPGPGVGICFTSSCSWRYHRCCDSMTDGIAHDRVGGTHLQETAEGRCERTLETKIVLDKSILRWWDSTRCDSSWASSIARSTICDARVPATKSSRGVHSTWSKVLCALSCRACHG